MQLIIKSHPLTPSPGSVPKLYTHIYISTDFSNLVPKLHLFPSLSNIFAPLKGYQKKKKIMDLLKLASPQKSTNNKFTNNKARENLAQS